MNSQRQIIALIKSVSGQANVLTIPRVYVDILKSHRAALLLSQCVYWSDKTDDPDGWFYKTFNEWNRELGMNQHAIDTARGQLEELGLVKTKIGKVNGTNKNHWMVDFEKLVDTITNHLAETASTPLAETAMSDIAENAKSTIAKITTKTTIVSDKPKRELTEAQKEISKLEVLFCELTGRQPPARDTIKQRKAAGELWWGPLTTILQHANGGSDKLIRTAIKKMRDDHLTISTPKSIEKVAISMFGENKNMYSESPAAPADPYASLKRYINEKNK